MKQLFCIVGIMVIVIFMPDFLCGGKGPERISQSSELKGADNSLRPKVEATERNLAVMDNQSKLGKSDQSSTIPVSDEYQSTHGLEKGSLGFVFKSENMIENENVLKNDSGKQGHISIDNTTPTFHVAMLDLYVKIVNSFTQYFKDANNPTDVGQVVTKISDQLVTEGLDPLSSADQKDILSTLPAKIDKKSSSWVPVFIQKILDVLLRRKKSGNIAISAADESAAWLTFAKNKISPDQFKDPNTNIILDEFAKLPAKARPADISAALDRMDKGEIMHDAILSGDRNQIVELIKSIDLKDASKIILTNLLTGNDLQGSAVDIGMQLAKDNPVQWKQVRDAYLTILVDMQWGLFKKSMVNKEGFVAGSITVVDPDGKFMMSMENYVKFVNPKFNAKGLSMASITNGDAYNRSGRLSSHWKGQVAENRIYGIDVQFDGKYTQALPQNKDQLHFAQLTNNRVFVKWEYYGTTLNMQDVSALKHSVTFVEDLVGPKKAASRSEAKKQQDVTAKFNEILTQLKIKLTPAQAKIVKQQGISGMISIIKEKNNLEALRNFEFFLTRTKGYASDTLQYRKANEVILGSNNNLGIATPAQ